MEQGQQQDGSPAPATPVRFEAGDQVDVQVKPGGDWWAWAEIQCVLAAGDYIVMVGGKCFRMPAERIRYRKGWIQ